jgi:predicted nucleotidyltransferase
MATSKEHQLVWNHLKFYAIIYRMTLKFLENKIRLHKHVLKERFSVSALYVFGSVAKGHSGKESDVDIIVEFSSDEIGLFEFVDLKIFLECILDSRVDLVTRDAINKRMIAGIEKDAIRVA